MQIFNRWGELLYETYNHNIGWDGTYGLYGNLVETGSYTYRIRYKVLNNDEYKITVGHVNLLK